MARSPKFGDRELKIGGFSLIVILKKNLTVDWWGRGRQWHPEHKLPQKNWVPMM